MFVCKLQYTIVEDEVSVFLRRLVPREGDAGRGVVESCRQRCASLELLQNATVGRREIGDGVEHISHTAGLQRDVVGDRAAPQLVNRRDAEPGMDLDFCSDGAKKMKMKKI